MEVSQLKRDEDERMIGAIESGMFRSALDNGRGGTPMNIDSLGHSPMRPRTGQERTSVSQKELPQRGAARMAGTTSSITGACAVFRHRLRGGAGLCASDEARRTEPMRVPDERQRRLTIRKFDGSELYRGLGSGFLDRRRTFMRQVQYA